ncbi:uncharacterized protein LDX57_012052 [Aspergillus melleus]|uniref:uncharacterized protein n=1 Tax=Aspergillus melleus TaxID=138277 RepID=UPI001E8DDA62|nr:uncharacterized protein LDX57_012052 [Aspergillus melleus]KAH8434405.1 hypothetical protein LDX57_012052 [Aspergillus melleus]
MPTVTSLHQYTFSNWGPLTTAFTPPASCTGYVGLARTQHPASIQWLTNCASLDTKQCTPSSTIASSPTGSSVAWDNPLYGFQVPYYSPGVYCPSGWATVGVAGRDGDSKPSLSGIFTGGANRPTVANQPIFHRPSDVLVQLLDPSETAVVCCPSSMTLSTDGGCHSTLPAHSVTSGCQRLFPMEVLTEVNATFTQGDFTVTGLAWSINATSPITSTAQTTIATGDSSLYVGVSVVAPLTLVHQPTDTKTGGAETEPTESSSNGAPGSRPEMSSRGGLGGLLGVWMAAMVAGAAMVLL